MKKPKTLIHALENTMRHFPDRGITFLDRKSSETLLTYNELFLKSKRIASLLKEKGYKEGDRAILIFGNDMNFILAFWGCLFAEIIPSPLPPLTSLEQDSLEVKKFINVQQKLDAFIFTDSEDSVIYQGLNSIFSMEANSPEIMVLDKMLSGWESESEELPKGNWNLEQIAFIQFSSGSTSDPKGIQLTHENIMTNVYQIADRTEIVDTDRSLTWLPYYHNMGLIGFHLTPLVKMVHQHKLGTMDFLRRPLTLLEKIDEYQIRISGIANSGLALILRSLKQKKKEFDLSSLRLMFIGAEPVSANICRMIMKQFGSDGLREGVLYPVYGLAETTLAVTFPLLNEEIQTVIVNRDSLVSGKVEYVLKENPTAAELVSVGTPVKELELRIVDENGVSLPEDHVGEIQCRSKSISKGYYSASQSILVDDDGWFSTEDLGFINEGHLYITGRIKDIIFNHGKNFYAHDIEEVAKNVSPDIFETIVVCGFRDAKQDKEVVVLFFVLKDLESVNVKEKLLELKSYLTKVVGFSVDHLVSITSNEIPRTISGKVQRFKLADFFEQGKFAENVVKL